MAALIAVRSVYTGTDQPVAAIDTGTKPCFCVGAVVGIYVNRKVNLGGARCLDQSRNNIVMIRTAGILCADGNLGFFAGKAISDAAHIDCENFCDISRNRSGAAVTDFFKNGDMLIDFAGGLFVGFL